MLHNTIVRMIHIMTQDYYRTGVLSHELMRGKLNRPKSMYIKTMNTNAAENGNRQLANFKPPAALGPSRALPISLGGHSGGATAREKAAPLDKCMG